MRTLTLRGRLQNLLAVAVCLALASPALAIGLDSTFGSGGKFMTAFSDTGDPSSSASSVFVQPSGRIVVVGGHQQQGADGRVNGIALAGLTSSGILDGTFGSGGKVLNWNSNSNSILRDSVMLPDGSILAFYQFLQLFSANRAILNKYTAAGQPDPTFNANLDIDGNQTLPLKLGLGSNGKIYTLVRLSAVSSYHLVRLNSDGSRDTTFGPNGVRPINLRRIPDNRIFAGLHELENGKIVLTGHYELPESFEFVGFAVRYDSDTNIDRSFGMQGVMFLKIPNGHVILTRSLVQADGKLLLAGEYLFLGGYTLLIRLTNRGRYDTTFGSAGISMTSVEDISRIYGVVIAPNGKIIVAGSTGDKTLPSVPQMFVGRFSANGAREEMFTTGFITGRQAGGSDVALQPDGKIVAAGFTLNPTGNFTQLAAARFLP